MSAKVISLLLSRLNQRQTGERARRERHLDLRLQRIDDEVRRINAEKERELEARLRRVVVDDFMKRRQGQYDGGNNDENNR